ncbi:CRAL-TRIO domain-containing protein [Cercophora newfieldiana]|uniref:CRAL-TRIO domain-containing protein n=1 Tax=Cercophora newfieldiana TaxID=92897 RepID=A0AA40CNM2_9PEZI|nr:CRAL-TRIO domain-containing protein [Cercophora newfieldiana]
MPTPPDFARPGHLGNLTPEQALKLQQTWIHLLRLCNLPSSVPHRTPNLTPSLQPQLADPSPASVWRLLWNLFLHDHPDVTLLRFLRARKWDVPSALSTLLSVLNWRRALRLDDVLIRQGDSLPSSDQGGFLAQYRSGKAYVRGSDRQARPVFVIKVALHDPKAQTEEAMEMFILHSIETIRTMMRFPEQETSCLVFDLSGFGMRNMDFHVVRFLVQVFEARYPEYLGVLLVHNAPFVFGGIWRMIKPWLDPVIVSKINFTTGNADLARFIAPENLQTCYGGSDAWEYRYIEHVEGENARMQSEKKDEMHAERNGLIQQFELLTVEWASFDPDSVEGRRKAAERDDLAKQLGDSFWKLDPYVRARTYYHRAGVIDNGVIDFKAAK